MPDQKTLERARRAKREGKSPSTQAGEFVHEEIEHIRKGKHGAQSTKQAIAIGLSKARRAGVKLSAPKRGKVSESVRRKAERDLEVGRGGPHRPSAKRSRATEQALQREGKSAGSHTALSRQARSAARKRSPNERAEAARKAAKTKGPQKRSAAARKAARTRRRSGHSKESAVGSNGQNKWSHRVMETSDALDLEAGVFELRDPEAIARSLKKSAEASTRRKATPFVSAMSMLNFYINRAGRNLPGEQREILQRAKEQLRGLYHRPPRP